MHDNREVGKNEVEKVLREGSKIRQDPDESQLISRDLNANAGMERNISEVQRLKEQVKALERKNFELQQRQHNRDSSDIDVEGGAGSSEEAGGSRTEEDVSHDSVESIKIDEMKLIDVDSLEGEEGSWLVTNTDVGRGGEREWLREDVENNSTLEIVNKKTLVNRLDDLVRRSPSHAIYSRGSPNSSVQSGSSGRSILSPPLAQYLKSHPVSSTPSGKYSGARDRQFDSRTFRRGQRFTDVPVIDDDYDDNLIGIRKISSDQPDYHRLAFSKPSSSRDSSFLVATDDDNGADEDIRINTTFNKMEALNNTFSKVTDTGLNTTFNKLDKDCLNSTFNKLKGSDTFTQDCNGTVDISEMVMDGGRNGDVTTGARNGDLNSTFNKSRGLNSTFNRNTDTNGAVNNTFNMRTGTSGRKMSEDRLSSASSSCEGAASHRLSRDSSHDGLLDDCDRLSTASVTSESSVSHRLNDVQDVQDLARMQEESLKHGAVSVNTQRSATMSPSSEQSLCSPMGEETAGYQSEESCGSDGGVARGCPRRGETQYNNHGQYSSQDSLPDSPYSSQSLDSHPSQGHDLRRSMPNLNKVRGGARRGAPHPQYGLSQNRHHNSDTRLPPPATRLMVPGSRLAAPRGGFRVPVSAASQPLVPRGRPMAGKMQSGLRPPSSAGAERKTSNIGRPAGIPRPSGTRLPAPAATRRGLPRGGGGAGRGRGGSSRGGDSWMDDCY